ncbi:MAG: helix-turn-helix domain-containing protein [Defluviitaleaceae bacterium]|nr:helix-turn-helix domain-containing protein [Defluviitaleaceae bacterium]MCL2240415.1 helix-turn-helix domain-containing protein [Defluviitaleaceae bacterium]
MLDNVSIGNQILLLRKRNGFTQEELAEKLGISAQAISKWENGHTLPETAILPILAKLLNCSIDVMLSPVVFKEGTIIPFGKHHWRVLKADGNSALIITESVIEQRAYHEEFTEITWEHCDLRKYLNKQFYDTFDPLDRTRILETKLTDSHNAWYGTKWGNPTVDKIFLLSTNEVLQYFGDSGDLKNNKRWHYPGDHYVHDNPNALVLSDGLHCIEYGECISDQYNNARKALYHKIYNAGWDERTWWLRSPGIHLRHTNAIVGTKGELFVCGADVYMNDVGVRPTLWLSI